MANAQEPPRPEGSDPIIVPTQALIPDQLVESLVPDPSQPPTTTVSLTGLLGRSAKEGYWRLYFSSTLERYAEFKEEDVLNSVKIPQEQTPFAGLEATRVWLRRGAEIEYTRTESRRVQAEFLSGDFAARAARAQATMQGLPEQMALREIPVVIIEGFPSVNALDCETGGVTACC